MLVMYHSIFGLKSLTAVFPVPLCLGEDFALFKCYLPMCLYVPVYIHTHACKHLCFRNL